jgi:hypothetical protein
MRDIEALGAFYLGRRFDPDAGRRTDEPLLLDAKDLTTHAVLIGMTGSGKTGLGVGLLEEALLDRVPVIAIDPKGDLGNLALRFPALRPQDFRPWVDPQQAAQEGVTPDALAESTATRWRDGLAAWGQDGARIQRLVDAASVTVYTPGSRAGRPLSVLRAFTAPPPAIRQDDELLRERVSATVTSLLALVGTTADPLTSPEHLLLSTLLDGAWREGRDLDLAALITGTQSPPFATVGVMPVDTVFPPKERMALAMRLNALLAAPAFQGWMQGDPLDTAALLHDPAGRPRASILSIAHLGDAERMFFVTLVLADLIAWMRQQPGTGSLRAILYIDELFGYMPPVAAPPSKVLLLTLLKQARAFGLGVVLATQNPVDLDYRGLSNAGLWCIGRLQTERDLARVMDGLAGVAGGAPFDQQATARTISGLAKRVFLVRSVHQKAPVLMETRWTLSYLAGPLTREQLKQLPGDSVAPAAASPSATMAPAAPAAGGAGTTRAATATTGTVTTGIAAARPILPPEIPQVVLPWDGGAPPDCYRPALLGVVDVTFVQPRLAVAEQRRVVRLAPLEEGAVALDWDRGEPLPLAVEQLGHDLPGGVGCLPVPRLAATPRSYAAWGKALQKWVVANEVLTRWRSAPFKLASEPGEDERAFRIRLAQHAHEARDAAVEKLRARHAPKVAALQEKIRRAEQAVAREQSQATQATMDTAISVGGALLGALLGRGSLSGSVGRMGTAARGAGRAVQQRGDVQRAQGTLEELRGQEAALAEAVRLEAEALATEHEARREEVEAVAVRAKAGDVQLVLLALAWVPEPA